MAAQNVIVYFDMETGGVEPKHPTIQLAAIAAVADNGPQLGTFEQKIAFDEATADPEALAMNHYAREAWTSAVTPAVCAAKFAAWLRPYQCVQLVSKRTGKPYSVARLAGYNAVSFDFPRLKAMFGASFLPCEYLVRDILQRALFYFDEHPEFAKPENFKLSTVCERFNVSTDGAHDALADVRMCRDLHAALIDRQFMETR